MLKASKGACAPVFLSQEAERTLRACHKIKAKDGRALHTAAAKEALQYALWDQAHMDPSGAPPLASFRFRAFRARRASRRARSFARSFVRVVSLA